MSVEDIVRNHVFYTLGSCGPCRFGTYITEYRKAVRDAGFEGFRVFDLRKLAGQKPAEAGGGAGRTGRGGRRRASERRRGEGQPGPGAAGALRRGKWLALNGIPLPQAGVDGGAAGLLPRARPGLPLDEPRRAARRYASLSAEQVRAAFARWLRLGDLAQVTRGPAPH